MEDACKNCLEAKEIGLYIIDFKYFYAFLHKPFYAFNLLIFFLFSTLGTLDMLAGIQIQGLM